MMRRTLDEVLRDRHLIKSQIAVYFITPGLRFAFDKAKELKSTFGGWV